MNGPIPPHGCANFSMNGLGCDISETVAPRTDLSNREDVRDYDEDAEHPCGS